MSKEMILELKNISKDYYGVPALKNVSLNFKKGEIHGLIGENGAGKSTLIKIIAGAISKSSGEILFEDEAIDFTKPKDSIDAGIGVVYQEFNLFLNLAIYENIFFGIEIKNELGIINRKKMIEESQKIVNDLGFDFDVREPVKTLTTAYQQIVEIAKCLNRQAKVIIMDEPSAPLTDSEIKVMFDMVRELNKQGVTIIYISHKLNEIIDLTDRISVLRDGEYITTVDTEQVDENDLIKYMVGRNMEEIYPEKVISNSEVVLKCEGISGGIVKDVSFDLHKGEILGFGGLVGAGRTELMRLIFGADPLSSGTVNINDEVVAVHSPKDAITHGIALVPEDRKHHGLILNKSVFFNSALPSFNRFSKTAFKLVRFKKLDEEVDSYSKKLKLKANNKDQTVLHLSGGNQQKVVLSKWLLKDSSILILDEPTRGIDVGAKQEIYNLVKELAGQGKSIIVISSEMPELIGMSHRVLVMKDGKISGEVQNDEMTQERIMKLAS